MSVFEQHPKKTLGIVFLALLVLGFGLLELSARHLFGLGNVVVYQSNPVYGYRPAPSQEAIRTGGKRVGLNNLGLRTDTDWTEAQSAPKLLFLGDSITYGGSYVDNTELFSTLAGNQHPEWLVGNAGVNGWGVSNVKALVMDTEFTPANHYISTFAEEDFERGLNRFGGTPYWPKQPPLAFLELFYYWLYKINELKYENPLIARSNEDVVYAKRQAVRDLKAYDSYLQSKGFTHHLYITPTLKQARGEDPHDPLLRTLLEDADLSPIYLSDYLDPEDPNLSSYYHDAAHLSIAGHAKWANFYEKPFALSKH